MSGVIVVSNGGQLGLACRDQLTTCMPYLARLSPGAHYLGTVGMSVRTTPPRAEVVGVGRGCQPTQGPALDAN